MDRENEERVAETAAVAAPKERCRLVPLVTSLLCLASGWLLFGHYCCREYRSVGYLELARRAESEGDVETALVRLSELLASDPNSEAALFHLAQLLQHRDPLQAREHLRRLLLLNPSNEDYRGLMRKLEQGR